MKISDFIKELREFNQDADITLTTSETITLSYICKDPYGKELSKQDTPIVFIEPADCRVECTREYMNGNIRWCSFYDKACKEVEECNEYEEFYE